MSEYIYTLEFDSKPDTIDIIGFEIPIALPKKPAKKHFRNYGKSKKDQKFERDEIPKDLRYWPQRQQDAFISMMWHKRRNGEWWLINGKEIFINGKAWTFFNFWYTQRGKLPDFRMEAVDFFTVWEFCETDIDCYGVLDIKPRRIGDTEKTLFLLWEHCTRVRYQRGGMQNVKDDAAEKNFKRLVRSHNKMIWFFKPIIRGSDSPKKLLDFTYPEQKMTRKKLKAASKKGAANHGTLNSNFKFQPLDSSIDFESSIQGRYDGEQLGFYHLDEPGKITNFDIKEQWPVIRRALSLSNDRLIVGKALFTTTVEDYQKGSKSGESLSTLKNVEYFWKNSNPNDRDGNNRTGTGLYRYFRNCIMSDDPDEYGFYDEKATVEWVMNTRNFLEEKGDWDRLAQVKRQYPLTISDVFTTALDDCVLMPILLDNRKRQLEEGLDWRSQVPEDGPIKPKVVTGDLVWEGGSFGGSVMFMPTPNGKYKISHFPIKRNHKINIQGFVKPGNDDLYTFGVDPYDHMVEGKAGEDGSPIHSDGSGVIYRKYDERVDGQLEKNEEGMILEQEVHKMQSDLFACTYLNRPQDPYEFYEDMLKMAIYYGVPMFYEKDKPGVGNYFRNSKMGHGQSFSSYLKDRPRDTKTTNGQKKHEKGVKATAPIISLYVDALKWHVYNRIHNYQHIEILEDFRKFKIHNRTECDLTVAAGMALLAAGKLTRDRGKKHKEELQEGIQVFRKYKRVR